jgi:putative spermidine/putrescine transport system permease protein
VTSSASRRLAAVPALAIVGGFVAVSLGVTAAGSVGIGDPAGVSPVGLGAYRRLLSADGFWPAAAFSLRVAGLGTALALAGALALLWAWVRRPARSPGLSLASIQLTVTLPHLVWAAALVATLGQSGWLARVAHAVGLIDAPDEMWVIVRDVHGIGIVVHLVTKELPFLVLVALPIARRRVVPLLAQASTLGASGWSRFRLVFVPALAPALVPAAAVSFAFGLGAYEPGAVLGVQRPRPLAVVALERFRDADLARRTDAYALSMMLLVASMIAAAALWIALRRWATR